MRKCRSAGHRSRHATLWRRLALAAAVFCLCWHLADCIEDAMWPAMRYLSRLFPFTYYTDIFVDQMLRGAPVACSLPDMGYMSLFIVIPLLCLPRLRTICTEEKYWGRL